MFLEKEAWPPSKRRNAPNLELKPLGPQTKENSTLRYHGIKENLEKPFFTLQMTSFFEMIYLNSLVVFVNQTLYKNNTQVSKYSV